jgi:CheY-like chemotaxis protein
MGATVTRVPKPRILLVDDEALVRSMMLDVLAALGYETDGAVSAAEALALFADKDYGLAVIDFLMPEMNGAELADHLRLQAPGVKVLITTGLDDDPALARAQAQGALVLRKPMSIDRLRTAIDHLLSGEMPTHTFPDPVHA